VYGIIPITDRLVFDVDGIDGDVDVYTRVHGDMAAVVSQAARLDYRGLERQEALRYLVAHQQVVEAVTETYPILPMKFGTVVPDEERAERLLTQGESLFRALLGQIAGRRQVEVVVLWDVRQVFQAIGQEPAIVELQRQIVGQAPEQAIDQRVELGRLVKTALEQRRTGLRNRLLPTFQAMTPDLVDNPLMDDSMVVNVALLLDDAGRAELERQVELLDAAYAQGEMASLSLRFRIVGPLAPYSFATIEAQLPTFAAIDQARRMLDLSETSSFNAIKQAYRRLAGQIHPDVNADAPEATERMAALTQAYRLLSAYAHSQSQGRQDAQGVGNVAVDDAIQLVDFHQDAVNRTLLLTVSGALEPLKGAEE
jgi:hypothetical protein